MLSSVDCPRVDKHALARRFTRAAEHYDEWAELQRRSGERLLELLPEGRYRRVLDLGCGTGHFLPHLSRRGHELVALDLSNKMLEHASMRGVPASFVQADSEQLPFTENSFDLIFSNLMLQWCNSLRDTLLQLTTVLEANGVLLFSTLLPGSLWQLDSVRQQQGFQGRVNTQLSADVLRHCIRHTHCKLLTQRIETEVVRRATVRELLMTIKGIGAGQSNSGAAVRMGRKQYSELEACYEQYRDSDGLLPLSYQLFYGVVTHE